jgi:hypothetical protein
VAPAKQNVLSAEELFAAPDITEEYVEIPEWKGGVMVRAITKGQHQTARKRSMRKNDVDPDLFEINLLEVGLSAPKLSRDEIAKLKEKKAGAVERIIAAILRISGLNEEAAAEADKAFRD